MTIVPVPEDTSMKPMAGREALHPFNSSSSLFPPGTPLLPTPPIPPWAVFMQAHASASVPGSYSFEVKAGFCILWTRSPKSVY